MSKNLKIYLNKKILFVCLAASLIVLGILGGGFLLMEKTYQDEKVRVRREAGIAADAFKQHTIQVMHQVDVLLHGVRMVYLRNNSAAETEQFINGLNFDSSIIEDIFIAGADGNFIIPHDAGSMSRTVIKRDYFAYHKATPEDNLFISSVEKGIITENYRFRITRRIDHSDGSFGGVVIATVNPQSFTHYYREMKIGPQNVASLLGIQDKKLRARIPEPDIEFWSTPIETSLWNLLGHTDEGQFEYRSVVDDIPRVFAYSRVGTLPLVMLVGFSTEDVKNRVAERKRWLILVETGAVIFILMITAVLILAIISRDRLAIANQILNQLYRQLREQAMFDTLTGLASRMLFTDHLRHALQSAERNRERCWLMYLDLDGFKAVNDNFGHEAGDEVLKTVSARMLKAVRSTDTVCRWGGDEFLILLPKTGCREEAVEIAKRLIAVIQKPVEVKGAACNVSASIGIACFPDNARTPDELQKAADAAMYLAKKSKKDRAVLASTRSAEL